MQRISKSKQTEIVKKSPYDCFLVMNVHETPMNAHQILDLHPSDFRFWIHQILDSGSVYIVDY